MPNESLTFSIGADTGAFQKQMAGCMKQLVSLTAAFAAVREVADGFGQALDLGGRMTDLSSRTGELAGNLYLLETAFGKTGVGADKVGPSLNKLQKFVAEAAEGSAEANETLGELGLTVEDLAHNLPIAQMQIIAARIAEIQDPSQRAAAAMEVFGKSGGELLPILRNFSAEMARAKEETGSMSDVLNKSAGELDAMGEKLEGFGKARTQFYTGFAAQVSEAFNDAFAEIKVDWAGVGDFIGDTFAHGSIWGGMRQWQKHFGETEAIMHEIVAAADPLVQIGKKFEDSLLTAAERFEIAMGKTSLFDVLGKAPEKPWDKKYDGMLGAENYQPDFSDANASAKWKAAFERRQRIMRMKEGSSRSIPEMLSEFGSAFAGFQTVLPSGFGNQRLFDPQVSRRPRATSITGAQYDNSYKDSTALTLDDIIDANDPFGKAARDFLNQGKAGTTGKGKSDKSDHMAKTGGGRPQQSNPAAAAMSRIEAILSKVETKIPMHILS